MKYFTIAPMMALAIIPPGCMAWWGAFLVLSGLAGVCYVRRV